MCATLRESISNDDEDDDDDENKSPGGHFARFEFIHAFNLNEHELSLQHTSATDQKEGERERSHAQ